MAHASLSNLIATDADAMLGLAEGQGSGSMRVRALTYRAYAAMRLGQVKAAIATATKAQLPARRAKRSEKVLP